MFTNAFATLKRTRARARTHTHTRTRKHTVTNTFASPETHTLVRMCARTQPAYSDPNSLSDS